MSERMFTYEEVLAYPYPARKPEDHCPPWLGELVGNTATFSADRLEQRRVLLRRFWKPELNRHLLPNEYVFFRALRRTKNRNCVNQQLHGWLQRLEDEPLALYAIFHRQEIDADQFNTPTGRGGTSDFADMLDLANLLEDVVPDVWSIGYRVDGGEIQWVEGSYPTREAAVAAFFFSLHEDGYVFTVNRPAAAPTTPSLALPQTTPDNEGISFVPSEAQTLEVEDSVQEVIKFAPTQEDVEPGPGLKRKPREARTLPRRGIRLD